MRIAWIGLCAMLLNVSPLFAQESGRHVELTRTDGRKFAGVLVSETRDQVVLMIEDIRTPVPRSDIADIRYVLTVQQQYVQRRGELADDDRNGRYQLAYWLFQQDALELAERELKSLAEQFPEEEPISQLLKVVQARVLLQQQGAAQPPDNAPDKAPGEQQPAENDRVQDKPVLRLNQQQINRIRIFELPSDLTVDQPAYITVERKAIDALFDKHRDHEAVPLGAAARTRLRRARGWQQAQVIFNAQARELYDFIRVRSDPPAIAVFRRQLHQNYVLSYCGTVGCHGGNEAGDLLLLRSLPSREDTVYTNFYILDRYQSPTGFMIDRDEPERSLLLQYGLAQDAARTPHPDVPRWRRQFLDEDDPRYVRFINWIRMLWSPTPNYGITFDIPKPVKKAEEEPAQATE